MKSDTIEDYILKSERNLGVAAAVATAWPEARAKLISTFLGRLASRLKKKLKGWNYEQWDGRFFLDPHPGFSIWKPSWKLHAIALQPFQYGVRMDIGVIRTTDNTQKLPLHESLLSAVQKILPSAKSNPWWEAWVPMHSPATDWRKPEVLWRIHKDPAFLTHVANQLLEIAEVSAPIIDGLARKHAK